MTDEDTGITAVWHGGEYIDLYRSLTEAPFHCLNVWDHEAGTRKVPFSESQLRNQLEGWLRDDE